MGAIGEKWKCVEDVEKFVEANSFYIGRHFATIGMADGCFPLRCEKDFLAAYNACSPLKAIIMKRSKSFNSGYRQVINTNTKKEVKSGRAAQLRKLVRKPNVLQNEAQFFAQQNAYVDIFGYCPVIKIRPSGMPDEISQLWNIPPWLFDIEYTKKWLNQNRITGIYQSYKIYWEGQQIDIPARDLFFIFDDGIGTDCDTNLTIPDSRLIGLEYDIANLVASLKSRNTLIVKRGAMGILSNESVDGDSGSVPMRPQEREDIQEQFKKYGLVGQAYQVIITDANLKWQQMGFATKDLMLFEEKDSGIKSLCDTYGVPKVLMSLTADPTFDNQNQARKDFFENTIIPEISSRMEMFSNGVLENNEEGSDEEGKVINLAIISDFSKLRVLQEDKVQAATARKTLDEALEKEYKSGLITKNMWLERLGEEPVDDPEFDEYFDVAAENQRQIDAQVAVAQARGGNRQQQAA